MTRSAKSDAPGCRKQNLCAVILAAGTVAVLYFSYDPQPAGANPGETRVDLSEMQASLSTDIPESSAASGQNDNELHGRMAILMQVLLLEKGLRTIEGVETYSATFCKQEKIGGVLSEPEFMQLKLRHKPFRFMRKSSKVRMRDAKFCILMAKTTTKCW